MAQYGYWHIDIFPWMSWKASSNYSSFARTNDTVALGMCRFGCGSFAANKHIEWDVPITAGTWTLTVIHYTTGSGGICTPSIGGSDLATFDTYTAGNVRNVVYQASGIVIADSAIYELKLRTDSKNASSSAYDLSLHLINLTRTA